MNYLFDNLIKTQQNKIICLAKNYLNHVKEMGGADVPPYPLVFGKPWSSLVWQPNPIKLKTKDNHKIDHEDSKRNGWPWTYAKGQDTFLPISQFVEKSQVIDPHNLELTLWINEKIRQHDNTGSMHYKIGETLEHLTNYITLNKGDLILTGTPSGIGPIAIGDQLRASLKQDGKTLVEMNFNVEEEMVSKF